MLLFAVACCFQLVASIASRGAIQFTSQPKASLTQALSHPLGERHDITTAPSAHMRPASAFWDDDLASSADFEKAADKGGALICALQGTDRTAGLLLRDKRSPPSAASAWTGDLRAELQTWYWRVINPTSKGCYLNKFWQIAATLQALGLDGRPKTEGGDNLCHRIEHWDPEKQEDGHQVPAINQWYTVDGNNYRATKAHFEFIVNTKGGAIFGLYLDGPKSAARQHWFGNSKDPDIALLPRLRSFSDVMWAYWIRDNPDIQNIRYFFMLGISNDQTNQLIASCLEKAGKKLSEWPGLIFDTSSDEGHALLGSQNGATFAYFLIQHKAELGYKTITKVTIIRPESDDDNDFVDASLVFHVGEAPEPPPDEEERKASEPKQANYAVEVVEEDVREILRVHEFSV
ncbi:hypothetical protein DE146DRAFT_753290 [Phaeosphaeria sp. MPI-PUGE-AT-0046c]|nr:hypothetical protein DE146DRAFT_753290 [Phaeosphaeria sp. MPI-PUGE-AT-0046c]